MAAQHQGPQRHRQQVGDRVLQGVRVQGRQPHLGIGDIKLEIEYKSNQIYVFCASLHLKNISYIIKIFSTV